MSLMVRASQRISNICSSRTASQFRCNGDRSSSPQGRVVQHELQPLERDVRPQPLAWAHTSGSHSHTSLVIKGLAPVYPPRAQKTLEAHAQSYVVCQHASAVGVQIKLVGLGITAMEDVGRPADKKNPLQLLGQSGRRSSQTSIWRQALQRSQSCEQ
ncbi:hypothetical protein BS50DRAFT_324697 [Corynespora cassiicola Philippines]|uniref:Uncharacterized protein n=1 Tax=Corynespora cassiicola Philippines TaxID=1448308 RepID=A0A2T2NTR4_CORCC|nr:hypothetical protein BS50DRAFT_324697 [Corynespora cassiicola Philippines]